MQYVTQAIHHILLRQLVFIIFLAVACQSCATKAVRDTPRVKYKKHHKTVSKTKLVKDKRDQIISSASSYIGTKYRYGGRDRQGFDCSGLVSTVFFENKIDIRGNSKTLAELGSKKTINNARIGDLVFFKKGNRVNHVAFIASISDNELWVIHSTSSRGVIKENIFASTYWNSKEYFIKDLL